MKQASLIFLISLLFITRAVSQDFYEEEKVRGGWRVDTGIEIGVAFDNTINNKTGAATGANVYGYYVFPDKKFALGGNASFMYNDAPYISFVNYYVGPVLSYTVNPFERTQHSFEVSAGCMIMDYHNGYFYDPWTYESSYLDFSTDFLPAVKLSYSLFLWYWGTPMDMKINLTKSFAGNSVRNADQFKRHRIASFEKGLWLTVSIGFRFGNY